MPDLSFDDDVDVSGALLAGVVGLRHAPEVIMVAVRWFLRYGLSYRDVEELGAQRGVEVDHVTVYLWVQCFTPLLIDAVLHRGHYELGVEEVVNLRS